MSGYHESRAVLRDAEAMCEIEVRGGVEADDGSDALDVTVRYLDLTAQRQESARTMRVSRAEWQAWVRDVRALR